jgi:hypothetical protein
MTDLSDDLLDGPVGPEKALPDPILPRGWRNVACLRCGEVGKVHVYLREVTVFECGECESDWTAREAREALTAWARVLEWVASAPVLD